LRDAFGWTGVFIGWAIATAICFLPRRRNWVMAMGRDTYFSTLGALGGGIAGKLVRVFWLVIFRLPNLHR
jgi:hypothetical protein